MSLALFIAAAAAFADLDAIDRQVAAFTGAPIGAVGGATQGLDRRLRLRPCISPLALAWRSGTHDTIVAECPDAGGWRLFVPVRGMAGGMPAAPAINRGDAVTIAVGGPGFSVSQPGEAMESGPVGAWIRVRGLAAKAQQMRGRVASAGVVEVPLP